MKYFVSFFALSMVVFGAGAAQNARPAMANKMMAAPRYTVSMGQLNVNGSTLNAVNSSSNNNSGVAVVTDKVKVAEKDMREAERNACINNNIGIGNTFVWASRYSDTSNYTRMVEDTVNPDNNVCFVRVELKSSDESRISVSDVPAKYFMWGEAIECGSWADQKEMEKRILDTRKGARVGGIIASTVGGAGLGVGAMELFGNKLIGNGLQGQKELEGTQLYRSALLAMKEKDSAQFESYKKDLRTIKIAHENNKISEEEYKDYADLINEFVD